MLKGVVLAGGKGTRLGELTRVTNKHLLPVGMYPMVYWPIKKLVAAGITDILLVTGVEHAGDFVRLLGSGRDLGCSLTYRVQDEAAGIAHALGLARGFVGNDRCVVVLGDNIFHDSLAEVLPLLNKDVAAAGIVLARVTDPKRYGVAVLEGANLLDIVEKPERPASDYAVAGIYVYPPDVFDVVSGLQPSARGELEITDVNLHYLRHNRLTFTRLLGYWTDAGTPESLALANGFARVDPPR